MLLIRNLNCGYDNAPVVHVENLLIKPKEVIAVVGRSGGGKTTLLSTLSGSLPELSGEVLWEGKPASMAWRRRHVVRTIQSFPLLHWHSVAGNIRLAAKIMGISMNNERIHDLLSEFSADHLFHKFPKEMSGGERVRASLTQAAIGEPKLLLLDEPLTGLDPVVKQEVSDSLFKFALKKECCVILVTHNLQEAISNASSIVVLESGCPNTISKKLNVDEAKINQKILDMLTDKSDG